MWRYAEVSMRSVNRLPWHDWIAAALGELTNWMNHGRPVPTGRVVVFKLDHLGDLVLAIPTLEWLEKRGCEVTLVVGSWNLEFASLISSVHHVLEYSSPRFSRSAGSFKWAQVPVILRAMAASDGVVMLRGTLWLLAVSFVFGWWKPVRTRGRFRIQRRLHLDDPVLAHEANQIRAVVGAPPINLDRPLFPGAKMCKVSPQTALVNVGAAAALRVWNSAAWRTLIRELRLHGYRIVAVGKGSDYHDGTLVDLCDSTVVDRTTLSGLIELIQSSTVTITADGGLAHLAAASGVPTVVLFGPQSPKLFRPLGHVAIVYDAFSCSPCDGLHCLRPSGTRCMEVMSVSTVLRAIDELVDGSEGRPE